MHSREDFRMERVKIAITTYEPALYTDLYPVFEDSPHLIIVDEYNRIQKYSPEITAKGTIKGKTEWIISRGAKVLVTGSIEDEHYEKLTKAGIAVDWVGFGNAKDLVERARKSAVFLLDRLEKAKVVRKRFDKRLRPKSYTTCYEIPYIGNDPQFIEELERKAKRQGKKRLLKPKDEDEELDEGFNRP